MNKNKVLFSIVIAFFIVFQATSIGFTQNITIDYEIEKSISRAIKYLHDIQNDDGGFPAKKGRSSSIALTCWVIMALTAVGEDVKDSYWTPKDKNPIDFIKNSNVDLQETVDYARMLLALTAANEEIVYNGENLLNKIISFQKSNGEFYQSGEKGMINTHIWSILAIASTGNEIPNKEKAKQWLISNQNEDGGFGWLVGVESDSDDTAAAIQALILFGEDPDSLVIKKAFEFIKNCQQSDGGFSAGKWIGTDSNSASDSWVLQALAAIRKNPISDIWSIKGKNALTHLLSLQNENGSFDWKKGISSSPVQMTAYSIMALKGKPFPINISYEEYRAKGIKFSDVDEKHWAYDEIMELVERNVVSGYPDGTFKPEKYVSRAEFTKYIVNGMGLKDIKLYENLKFVDVSKEHWAYDIIRICVEKGIIKGRTEKRFDPNGKITGAELAAMLVRSLPIEKKSNLKQGPYWYSGYVEVARENNLLYPDFKPTKTATRAQCAYSIIQLIRNLFHNEGENI